MNGPVDGEYLAAMRTRYLLSSKKEKARLLDELVDAVGCHRKAAVRMLRRHMAPGQTQSGGGTSGLDGGPGHESGIAQGCRSGRHRTYEGEVVEALRMAWEATDYLCSRRLQPFLPELIPFLRRCGGQPTSDEAADELCRMSTSTIDRLLRPWRTSAARNRFSVAKPGAVIEDVALVDVFADRDDTRAGFFRVDLIRHCGAGERDVGITTLSAVDLATGWSESMASWGNVQVRIDKALDELRQRLPVALLGLECDFITPRLRDYCQSHRLSFRRYCSSNFGELFHPTPKSWTIARRLMGWDRYSSGEALDAMNRIYDLARLYVNFFQPTMKLVESRRHGSKARRVYAPAQTPYRRLLASGSLSEERREELAAVYETLDPIQLRQQIDENLANLRTLA